MKTTLFTILIFLASAMQPLLAGDVKTIKPGEIWPDDRGIHINAHGGGILFHEGTYYWFGEHKSERSSAALVGVTCYSSKDLMNWTYKGVALTVVTDDPNHEITVGSVIERPKVIYNAKTGKFVMWFHLELKGQGYNAARSAVAVADKVEGPYTYLRSGRPNPGVWPLNMSEAERKDTLKPGFAEDWSNEWRAAVNRGLFTRRDFAGGQMARDMTLYVDDNGKAYHIFASEENLTLNIAELTDDYLGHTGRYIRVQPGGHNEAPSLFKKDGKYFMITSGCTGWDPNAARLLTADSMMGEWTYLGNPCVGEGSDLTFRSQSTYILKIQGMKKDAFIFMADRWTPRNPIDARYIWLPILFEEGKPVLKWFDEWDFSIFK